MTPIGFFGISIASFQVGGGMLLLISAIHRLNAQPLWGRTGINVMTQLLGLSLMGLSLMGLSLMGLILAAMAVELLADGRVLLFPILASPTLHG